MFGHLFRLALSPVCAGDGLNGGQDRTGQDRMSDIGVAGMTGNSLSFIREMENLQLQEVLKKYIGCGNLSGDWWGIPLHSLLQPDTSPLKL